MKSPLHILHLEDDPNDAALVRSTLETGGITCAIHCVQNRADFVAALERGGMDLILSDFSMPAFDGLSALEIARIRRPDIPFILVSGTLGEERAIDSLNHYVSMFPTATGTFLATTRRTLGFNFEARAGNR